MVRPERPRLGHRQPQRVLAAATLAAGLAAVATAAAAQPKPPADWPCIQRLVPKLTYGLLWTGPPLEPYFETWDDDPARARLVTRVTRLAVPAETAAAELRVHLRARASDSEEPARLFAGIFRTLNERRGEAIAAIRRYARGQQALLERIAGLLRELEGLLSQEPPPANDMARVQQDLDLTRRIFEARRQALPAMCEQPVLLEQRLGDLQRAIRTTEQG